MPTKLSRIALVSPEGLMPAGHPNAKLLLDALNELGYKLGDNLIFEAPATPPGGALCRRKRSSSN